MNDELIIVPSSLEAERAVIGSIILDNSRYDDVSGFLVADDFYHEGHKIVYQHIEKLLAANSTIDFLTLRIGLEASGSLEATGGMVYLSQMIDVPRNTASTAHYGQIVKEKARLRALARVAYEIGEMVTQDEPSAEVMQAADEKLSAIYPSHFTLIASIDELLEPHRQYLDRLQANPAEFRGFPTGLVDLDRATDGIQPGEMTIIAARPSMGKTAFATTFTVNNPRRHIAFFSIEQSTRQILNRMISKIAQVDGFNLRRGYLDPREWSKVYAATAELDGRPLWIYDDPVSLHQIRSRIRKLRTSHNLEIAIIDYLGLIRHTLPKHQQHARRDIVTDISHTLKNLGKETGVSIVLLHQLNREAGAGDERPQLHHLRESGDIEADGDLILFLWDNKGQPTITIGKQRNGPTADVKVFFKREYTDFRNSAEEF